MAYIKSGLMGPHRLPRRPKPAQKAQAAIARAFDKWARNSHRPMPQGPPQITGFPGMGDMRPPPAWQTQQPGFYESDQMGQGPGPDGAPDPRWEGTLDPAGLEALGGMQGPSQPFDTSALRADLMGMQQPQMKAFSPGMFPGMGDMRRPPRQLPPNFMELVRQFAGQRSAPQGRFGRM